MIHILSLHRRRRAGPLGRRWLPGKNCFIGYPPGSWHYSASLVITHGPATHPTGPGLITAILGYTLHPVDWIRLCLNFSDLASHYHDSQTPSAGLMVVQNPVTSALIASEKQYGVPSVPVCVNTAFGASGHRPPTSCPVPFPGTDSFRIPLHWCEMLLI